ncbi:uncharacterized protein LOC129241631 [Anastrepha obliqua]|uniref:uncharacterized protein LOC129241631 n=1 Tax=Anastrepha obliqua TaxID=95512 RepID=UPI002409A427|nr:uncharacterized protein LOC129241631 [Anastrepha obliqua]
MENYTKLMTENLTTTEMFSSSALLTATNGILEHNTNSTISTLLQATPASATTTNKTADAMPTDTDIKQNENGHFILIPFVVLSFIIAFSAVVFLIVQNRRRLARIYCRRRSERRYSFDDDSDSTLEQGDGYDFDDPSECLLKGKLQIDNSYASALRKDLYT